MLVWRKLSSAKWEDAWLERLRFLNPQQIVIAAFAGAKTIRIEAYALTKSDAKRLLARFGGQVRDLKNRDFVAENAPPSPPLNIRGRLLIVRSEKDRQKNALQFAHGDVLVIPAAMAFGTGDHATTSTCLRLLCDAATNRRPPWDMLDLGTGTGILAIAARALGARHADAFDFDSACIRTARSNVALNNVKLRSIQRVDVTKWQPTRRWEVVTANLYSEILIRASPQICDAVAPAGRLVLSGIMREQEKSVLAAFRQNFAVERIVRRGKWVAISASANGEKSH
ncbi:MAG: ribosomal protein methyltransferase [Chthoniobacter sp.]|jgi:ribosomal protein L11 methyltransferase|nr:ribosomal protein methyltransferase [Chthoniobacter sp.]